MSTWKERREAGRQAVAQLDQSEYEYAEIYNLYDQPKSLLHSDDPFHVWLGREILWGLRNRDLKRIINAVNESECLLVWLPEHRVRYTWEIPVPLTSEEFMILSYHMGNIIYTDERNRCYGFEARDQDYFDFLDARRKYGRPNATTATTEP